MLTMGMGSSRVVAINSRKGGGEMKQAFFGNFCGVFVVINVVGFSTPQPHVGLPAVGSSPCIRSFVKAPRLCASLSSVEPKYCELVTKLESETRKCDNRRPDRRSLFLFSDP